jgi:hypothetical protein
MTDIIETLECGAEEIRALRRRNEILQAKVDMIDLFAAVLFAKPPEQTVGYGEDVAWRMSKLADHLRSERPRAPPAKSPTPPPEDWDSHRI